MFCREDEEEGDVQCHRGASSALSSHRRYPESPASQRIHIAVSASLDHDGGLKQVDKGETDPSQGRDFCTKSRQLVIVLVLEVLLRRLLLPASVAAVHGIRGRRRSRRGRGGGQRRQAARSVSKMHDGHKVTRKATHDMAESSVRGKR